MYIYIYMYIHVYLNIVFFLDQCILFYADCYSNNWDW